MNEGDRKRDMAGVWELPGHLRDAMLAHCYRSHPVEACGVVVGPKEGEPTQAIPMTNAEDSVTAYRFDEGEQLALWERLDLEGLEVKAVYHSHTMGPAEPSMADLERGQPGMVYLIISTTQPLPSAVRAWKLETPAGIELRLC